MSSPIVRTIDIDELDSAYFEGVLRNEQQQLVTLAQLSALTLKLYNQATDAIINSRNGGSVLNANGGTFHATNGTFTMTFASADNPIVDTAIATGVREVHHALFIATWSTGGRKSWIVRLRVKQMHLVP